MSTSSTLPPGVTRETDGPSTLDAVGNSLPVGFRATSSDEGFALVVKKRGAWVPVLTVFALGWNGFMVLWFTMSIATGAWMMAAFGTVHALVGVLVGYIALRGLLNRIELRVSRGVLTVAHKPLPWFSPPPLRRDEIDQLFVQEDHSLRVNGRTVVRFQLRLREKGGRERQLLIVEEARQAQYLEREIERAFEIEDRAQPHEVPKN